MKDLNKIINSTPLPHEPSITTTDLKSGVGGNYVVNKDWHDPATLTHEEIHTLITQTVERTVEEVVEMCAGKKKKCEFCQKIWDEDCRDYDGMINCTCAKGRYSYTNAWDEFGYNQALDDIIQSLRTELLGKEKDNYLNK